MSSSLRERLEARQPETSVLTVRGERFSIHELSKGLRAEVIARHRDSKGRLQPSLDGEFLSRCVRDPDSDVAIYSVEESAKWDELGSGFTGPLMAEVMRLNGLDDEDVGREVKKSEAAESSE